MCRSLAAILLLSSACAAATTVELKTTASVTGPDIQVGDVATVKTDHPAIADAVARIFLRVAPPPSHSCIISSGDVYGQLLQNGVRATIRGARQVAVTTAFSRVKAADIFAAARSFVLGQVKCPAEDMEVSLRSVLQDVTTPKGTISLQPVVPGGSSLIGAVTIPVRILIDGQFGRVVSAPVTIRMFREALVTTKAVSRDEPLDERSLALRKCEVSHMRGELLSDLSQVRGKVSARTLPAGTILTTDHVAKVDVIRRGDVVKAQLNKGCLQITLKGVAMRDGAIGDLIPVQNVSSRRVFGARVVGPRFVVVTF